MTGFVCKVCLQQKPLIYGHQGLTVRVLVEDEQIKKEGLYALVVHPLLKDRSDLQVKLVLLKVEVAGKVEVVTNIENPCLQKYKLRQAEIGTLVWVDELNEDQINEHFGNYAEPQQKPDLVCKVVANRHCCRRVINSLQWMHENLFTQI